MDRRQFLAALAFVALAGTAWADNVAPTPRDIVAEIYKISAGKSGKYDGPSAFSDKSVRQRYFSKSLLAAVVAMEKKSAKTNEPILDFDPVTNSQEPFVKDLAITEEEKADAKIIVAARFTTSEANDISIVRYHFIKEGKAWKLDEIAGSRPSNKQDEPWSLRAIIK